MSPCFFRPFSDVSREERYLLRLLASPDRECRDAGELLLHSDPVRWERQLTEDVASLPFAEKLPAIEALGLLRATTAVPLLITLLQDPVREVRWASALALGQMQSSRSARALQEALDDRDGYVRHAAALSLLSMNCTGLSPEQEASLRAALGDWEKVFALRAHAHRALATAIKDEDPVIRTAAVRTAGRTGDPGYLELIQTLLPDPDERVRNAAVDAALQCGMPPAQIPGWVFRRPKSGKNPYIAAFLNFLLPGIGYLYLGKWWGVVAFQIDVTATLWLFSYQGEGFTYAFLLPIYVFVAVHGFMIAKRMEQRG